ncbi:hypothetical protein BKN38_05165 [Helicobacter sp. CLO-3]|uniref:glycosyltransferase family 25 protein n=1 Tax=unclassified Helicobacter TaxID=2593540 RepID=UPI0008053ACB|nr:MULTISPECIES: glycosyltransferase family 25 protein [unclassified Helicobacter]OBV29120.1 hypothetical protein BA723_06700 [Helicobacter sp. CLO-3]OHU83712.1 hypothetical protein BKN38_05165 [Helicobacter sp. CLO-3]
MHKFFIINLERSTDRRAKMQANIDKLLRENPDFATQASFEFFKAKDTQSIIDSGFIKRYSKFRAGVWKAREVRATELACFASHFALWKKCVELDEPIFILEDDVDFCEDFARGVDRIAQSGYDFARLSWRTFHTMYLLEEHFALAPSLMLGTSAYYLTPRAARKLIKHAQSIFVAVDYYVSFSFLHGVKEMLHIPHLVHVNELDEISTIGKPEHQPRDKSFYLRFVLLREIHRIYRHARMWIFTRFALLRLKKRIKARESKRAQTK